MNPHVGAVWITGAITWRLAADQLLDHPQALAADRIEPLLLGLGGRDPADFLHRREAQLATPQRRLERGQLLESAGDAQPLAYGVGRIAELALHVIRGVDHPEVAPDPQVDGSPQPRQLLGIECRPPRRNTLEHPMHISPISHDTPPVMLPCSITVCVPLSSPRSPRLEVSIENRPTNRQTRSSAPHRLLAGATARPRTTAALPLLLSSSTIDIAVSLPIDTKPPGRCSSGPAGTRRVGLARSAEARSRRDGPTASIASRVGPARRMRARRRATHPPCASPDLWPVIRRRRTSTTPSTCRAPVL